MREQLNDDIAELLKKFLERQLNEQYYHYYEGKIVDNNDPAKLGRCKIRVYGIFNDSVADEDLPWAIPEFGFVGGKAGSFIVPPIDTFVNVHFDRGDIYSPHYSTKALDNNNLPEERNTDYPDTMILFKTDEGDILQMNRRSKLLTFIHNSGTQLTIDRLGNVDVEIKGHSDTKVDNYIKMTQTTSQASVEIDPQGTINITQGPVGSINIGGQKAQLYCPDLQVCPITGAPLSILTKIPGFAVKVP